ncbi:MAG: hypothetical protein ABL998_07565, partial [Planctomycetota bacterium]
MLPHDEFVGLVAQLSIDPKLNGPACPAWSNPALVRSGSEAAWAPARRCARAVTSGVERGEARR